MTHGTAYYDWFGEHRGRDQIHVQKKHNMWNHWAWWSCPQYNHKVPKRRRDQDIIYALVPLSNSMERGLFKRGITRRKYQICLLETRYPCQDRTNTTKPTKSAKRKYQNGRCFQARPVCRDQQTTNESCTIDAIESGTKRLCIRDRPVVDVTLRNKVFQGVGNDLIASWLTPIDLYNVKQAFPCNWDWCQTWHGGKVRDKGVAAQVALQIDLGKSIDAIIEMFSADSVFSALWFILGTTDFVSHAHRLKHWKSIRKLDRLRV